MRVQVTLTHDSAVLEALRLPWAALQDSSATDSLFMTWEWITTWWRHFGQGKQLWLLQAAADGQLVGLAPLVLTRTSEWGWPPVALLTLIGGGEPLDHLDFIIRHGWEAAVLPAFLAVLREHYCWQVLRLGQLPDYSPNLPLLRASGIAWEADEPRVAPYTPLPGDWETFWQSLTPKSRENQRRYQNKLSRTFPGQWAVDVAETPQDVTVTLDRMIALHQAQWQARGAPGSFASAAIVQFHQAIAHLLLERGWLRLYRLCIGEQIAGVAYTFAYRGRAYGYSMGIDHTIPDVALGHVLVYHAIQGAIALGLREYDFLWGDEEWKYKWNAANRYDHTLTWYAARRVRAQQALLCSLEDTWRAAKKALPAPVVRAIRRAVKGAGGTPAPG